VVDPACDGHEFVLVSGHLRLLPVQTACSFFHPPSATPERDQQSPHRSLTSDHGILPVVGVRIGNVFHILWIERQFGGVYDHG
jgi:hypothetical protein